MRAILDWMNENILYTCSDLIKEVCIYLSMPFSCTLVHTRGVLQKEVGNVQGRGGSLLHTHIRW